MLRMGRRLVWYCNLTLPNWTNFEVPKNENRPGTGRIRNGASLEEREGERVYCAVVAFACIKKKRVVE